MAIEEKKTPLTTETTGQQSFLFTQGVVSLLPPLMGIPGAAPDYLYGGLGPMPGTMYGIPPGGGAYQPQPCSESYSANWFVSGWNTIPGAPALLPFSYLTYRRMLSDPTIALAFAARLMPVISAKWSYKAEDDAPKEACGLIEKMFERLRMDILQDACRMVTMGWQGAEKLYEVRDGLLWLKGIKPLLHEITRIDIDTGTGDWIGFNNMGTELPHEKCVLWTYSGEAGNLYGRSDCENLRMVMANWCDANDGSARYDRKIAGVFLVLHYPPGSSIDLDGKTKSNAEIARNVLDRIVSGKPIALPNEFAALPGEASSPWRSGTSEGINPDLKRWRLELLEDKGGRQPTFIQRLEYLDMLKFRGALLPERAISEARKGGSRADSESHQDLVLLLAESLHARICHTLNTQVVDQILRLNWGRKTEGSVRIEPIPIVDERREYFQEIVRATLGGDKRLPLLLGELGDWMRDAGLSVSEDADAQIKALRDRAMQNMEQPDDGVAVLQLPAESPTTKALLSLLSRFDAVPRPRTEHRSPACVDPRAPVDASRGAFPPSAPVSGG